MSASEGHILHAHTHTRTRTFSLSISANSSSVPSIIVSSLNPMEILRDMPPYVASACVSIAFTCKWGGGGGNERSV